MFKKNIFIVLTDSKSMYYFYINQKTNTFFLKKMNLPYLRA